MKNKFLTTDAHGLTRIFETFNQFFLYLCLSVCVCGSLFFTASAQLNSGAQQNVVGQAGTFLIRNARIFTVSGAPVENGSLLIQNGKIAAVGANVNAPADAQVIDANGANVYPGMIDARTQMGLMEIPLGAPGTDDNAEIGEMNPNAKAIVSVNPFSAHVNVTRVNGITTVLTAPTGGIISGQAAIINLVGSTPYEMAVNQSFALVVDFPRVSRFGTGVFRFGQPAPDLNEAAKQRDQRLEDLRKMLRDSIAYGKAQDAYNLDKTLTRPTTDLKLSSLMPFARGEKPVIINADREIDIRNAVKFADEMKLKMILSGGNEAAKAADLLKQKNVPVILTGIWSLPARDDDYYDSLFETAAKLNKAGVRFCISTGDFGPTVRDLPYQAGMTVAYGLPKDEALKAVTIYPAQILGVDAQMGTLEVGKTANIVIADNDILQPTTKILHLFINGRKIPLTSRHTELYEQFKDRKASN